MAREFIDILTDLDDGEVNIMLSKELPRVVAAVMETGRAGSLTLKIDIKREKRMAIVKASVSTKIPAPDSESSIFYTTEDGDLCREDPRQLALRDIPANPPVPLRSAP